MPWLDFTGACLSLICTYYFTQAKRLAWLLGLIAILFNTVLYWQKGIYGHLILETTYFVSMIYGWFKWKSQNKESALMIRALRLGEGLMYSAIAGVAIFLFSQWLIIYTDSDIPYWDAISTVLSLLAQWLLCLRVLHCWILWFIVDAMIAGLQFYKGIPFHSALHFIYLGMAVWGFWRWRQIYISNDNQDIQFKPA